jgi:hypothetical protein
MVSWKAWFCEELRKAGYGYLPQAQEPEKKAGAR